MKRNKLFAFASTLNGRQSGALHFVPKTNREGTAYLLHPLPLPKSGLLIDAQVKESSIELRLTEHHLSFYNQQNASNPKLSEYHYTAIFQRDGVEYQLHVYFNEQDGLTIEPQLSILTESGQLAQLPARETLGRFIDLAREHSAPFMMKFRGLHLKAMQQDAARYQKLERDLVDLSQAVVKNPKAYLAKASSLIAHLEAISPYHYDDYYLSIIVFLKRVQRSLSAAAKELEGKAHIASRSSAQDMPIAASAVIESRAFAAKTELVKKSLTPVVRSAQKAFKNYEAHKNKKMAWSAQIKLLCDSQELMQKSIILSMEDEYFSSPQDIIALNTLLQRHCQAKQSLVPTLLLNQQFALAKQLIGLNPQKDGVLNYSLLTKLVSLALKKGDDKLLDFLLSNSQFPITTFAMDESVSPVLYCFNQHSNKRSKAGCLSVLLKHGASMVELDAKTGLPMAHVLLSTPYHPLLKSLYENKNTTLLNPDFYVTLIRQLKFIKERQIEAKGAPSNEFDEWIKNYQEILAELRAKNSALETYQAATFLEIQRSFSNRFTQTELSFIRTDPEINAKRAEFVKIEREFLDRLSEREKRAILGLSHDLLKTIDKYLAENPKMPLAKMKQYAIEHLERHISVYRDLIRLLEIQTVMKKFRATMHGRRKVPRYIKKMSLEEQKLQTRIRKHRELYNEIYILDPELDLQKKAKCLTEGFEILSVHISKIEGLSAEKDKPAQESALGHQKFLEKLSVLGNQIKEFSSEIDKSAQERILEPHKLLEKFSVLMSKIEGCFFEVEKLEKKEVPAHGKYNPRLFNSRVKDIVVERMLKELEFTH